MAMERKEGVRDGKRRQGRKVGDRRGKSKYVKERRSQGRKE